MMVPLTGAGVAASTLLSANKTSLSFGNVSVNGSSTLTVTLTNTGTGNVTISSIGATGPGYTANGIPANTVLTPNQTATLNVVFAPTSMGSFTGTATVASNATNSPVTIALSGGSHAVTLSWGASTTSGVTGYNVYRGTTSGGPYTKVNNSVIAGTTYTDTSVQSGTTYFYVVTSVDNNVESAYSNQVTAAVPTP